MKYVLKKIYNFFLERYTFFKYYKNFSFDRNYKTIIKNSIIGKEVIGNIGLKLIECEIQGNVELDRFVSINKNTKILGGIYGIKIGSFSSIGQNVFIQENYHKYERVSTYHFSQNIYKEKLKEDIYSKGKIVIEEDVWIGSNSVILSGIKIGRGSIIGAGSVVTKDVEPYSIMGGNPARLLKKRFDKKVIKILEKSRWWEWDLKKILSNKEFFLNFKY
ncbi:CatB-related O-acetyltransferase [Fusobacterium varium]|uniref:CatB-related O-acetyltransferase n=1 Tax=Fusobacterium varium TaxID=856 RepID=UPI0035664F12